MPLATGDTLAHYRVLSLLGAGGMGEVYLAQDTKLDRTVALKILPAEFAQDPERMRRFVQEAKAASALNHPNVAHIYEIGEVNGAHFIAMEYVEGQPLKAKIGQPMEAAEILDIGLQIADALDEAHGKGITHRDIKPANIMLTPRRQAKVLDFGLAKIGPAPGDATTADATETGVILGTVQYMSPEQALGRPVDRRSDLFSLGVVLYEMATGRAPFSGGSVAETLERLAHDQPEAIARFHYGLPAELERIIRKCLEKDRDRRYQSARELLVDLRNLKRDSDAVPSPHPRVSRSPRLYAAVAAVAVVAVILVAGGVYLRTDRGGAIESLAVLPFANVGGDSNTEYLSDGITENLINSLSQLPKLRVSARSLVFRYKGREVDPQKAGRDLNVGVVVTGRVVQRGDSLNIQADLMKVSDGSQLWGRQYDRKLTDIIDVQEQIAREVSGKLRLRLVEARRYTENTEAYQLYLKGRYYWNRRTGETLKKAAEQFQQAIEKDPNYALAWAGLADCYAVYDTYRVLPPNESLPRAREAARRALRIDETLAEPHAALGFVKTLYEWDWPGAENEFRKALDANPSYATTHSWYSSYLAAIGKVEEAIAESKRGQQLDPLSMSINQVVGRNIWFGRRYDEAIAEIRKHIEMDPNFARSYWYLGMAYERKGMYPEAIASLQKGLSLSGNEPTVSGSLGHAYAVSGNRGEAQKVLAELIAQSKTRYVSAYDIAVVQIGLGEKDRALQWLERAYEDHSNWLVWLRIDPRFDSLRNEPRYQNLVRRMRLTP